MKNLIQRMKPLHLPLYLLLIVAASCSSSRPKGSLSAEDGLKSLKLAENFHAELFASEPDIADPVDMVFDEQGRAFVAEMLDLPDDPPSGKPARGRIRMLEDTDGDGKADKSTIFAENLMHCSGLFPWKGGLIVPASPEILYLKDTNGDGKADVREVWFTGFFHGNPEAQITNPRLGPDGWIYFANTGNEGLVKSPHHPNHPPVQVRGNDFRYHPVKGIFEPASGTAQYGLTIDDSGNRFISQNTQHLRHVVLPRHYMARSPMLEVGTPTHDPYGDHHREMYPLTGPPEWRVIRTRLRQQRFDELKTGRTEFVAGHLTGATGGTLYKGDAWPAEYLTSLFTGDVSANLVRRDVIEPDGVIFRARPAPVTETRKAEFLASTDQWFRPTNFANAPDGNLYLTDMQREVIETPLSIPEELRKKINFYSGDTLGRIYRIVSNNPRAKRSLKVNLGAMTSAELAGMLDHPNGWHRETAQRLLLERQDKSIVPLLRKTPGIRALYLLDSMSALDPATVEAALRDPRPQVREHAIALAEPFPSLEPQVVAFARDPNPRIRFQTALSLGNFKSPAARAAVVEIAAADYSDRWIRTAAISSAADQPVQFFNALAARKPDALISEMVSTLGSLIGTRKDPAEIQAFIAGLAKSKYPRPGLAGLARGLTLAGAKGLKGPGIEAALAKYLNDGVESAYDVARHFELKGLIEKASKDALNGQLPPRSRALALSALRGAEYSKAAAIAQKALETNPPTEVQSAAVLAISSFDNPGVAQALLERWKSYTPEARSKVIGALLAQKDRIPALLGALEKGTVDLNAVETSARNRLLELSDAKLVERAKKILQTAGGDRAKVVAAFKDAINLKGDVQHGKQLFEDACSKCHQPRRQGGRVGPDLTGINVKSKEELLTAILNPSAAIEPRFVNYLVTTRDGRMYDGVLANETAGAITLRGGSEEDVTLPRAQIAEIRASSISLMPEDLEKNLSRQDLADLIAFLRGGL